MPEEGQNQGYDPRAIDNPMNATQSAELRQIKRKDSELENLISSLEKEIEILSMNARSFIENVNEVLSPEYDKTDGDSEAQPSPASPLGRRIFQLTYSIKHTRQKIENANERVRI